MKPNKPKAPAKADMNAGTMRAGRMPDVAPDAEERKWRAEDGMRTLMRAEEVKRDAGLMRDISKHRDQKMRDMAAIKVETAPRNMKMKCD